MVDTDIRYSGNAILQHLGEEKRVLVVGDSILDRYIHGRYARMAAESPLPLFNEDRIDYCLGGALNYANNMVALGLQVDCVTLVGSDGDRILNMLKAHNINTDGIIHCPGFQTKTITRYAVEERTVFRVDKVSNTDISSDIEDMLLRKVEDMVSEHTYDLISICDYRNGLTSSRICQAVIACAQKRNIPVAVDPKRGDYDKFKGASVIKPNASDAMAFCEQEVRLPADAEMVCKTFVKKLGLETCVLTMASDGMAFYNENASNNQREFQIIHSKRPCSVVDTNGGGDAAFAAVSFGIVHNVNMETSCRFAVACADYVIQRYGTLTPSLIDVLPDNVIGARKELENLKKIIPTNKSIALSIVPFKELNFTLLESLERAKLSWNIVMVALKNASTLFGSEQNSSQLNQCINALRALKYLDYIIVLQGDVPEWVTDILCPDIYIQ